MFLLYLRDWNFFESLANDDVKVNKTQQIPAKIDLELDSFSEFLYN